MVRQQLMDAYQLIKTGQKAQAEAQLRTLLEDEADNAEGWWLLANAATDPAAIREALERDLQLRPDHTIAQKALDALNRKHPPAGNDADFDDLFGDDYTDDWSVSRPATRTTPTTSKRNNQSLLLYGSIALIVLFFCGGIAVVMMEATRVVGEVANELGQMSSALADDGFHQTIPYEVDDNGSMAIGERKRGYVDTFLDDLWTFQGRAGQRVTIELNARDDTLDPELFLYSPDERLIAANDDIQPGRNLNSQIQITLPVDGRYTIVLSAFGMGGDYRLILG